MTLPVRGAPGSGTWGDTLDADLAIIDVMDHTPGHGPRVPVAGLNINADLPFSALWAPTQLHRVQFSAIASAGLTAGQRTSLFVSDGTSSLVANELYWHNSAGNKVQITAGNTLNFAAFVGGIGGDYTSVGATLNYTDGQKAYEFKEGTVDSHGWARLRSADLRLFPFNTTGAVFVGMAAPGAIAGSYTVTWPLALPGSTLLQQIDNSGQVIFSNTVPSAATFSALITASAGLTAAVNQDVTVSGTGRYRHGAREVNIHASLFNSDNPGSTFTFVSASGYATFTAGGGVMAAWVDLPVGKTIATYQQFYNPNATGGGITPKLRRINHATGVMADVAAGIADSSGSAIESQTMSGIAHTVLTGEAYFLEVAMSAANGRVYGATITYTE